METKTNYKNAEKEKACSNPLCEGLKTKAEEGEEMYDTPELEELRKQKNEYHKKYEECENRISELIAEIHEVPDYTGKWIKIIRGAQIDIMHVKSVVKVNFGLRIVNDVTVVNNSDAMNTGIKAIYIAENANDYIRWEDVSNIQILTNTESDVLDRLVFKVKETINDITSTQHI